MPLTPSADHGFPTPPNDSSGGVVVNDLAKLFFSHALRGLAPSTVRTYQSYLKLFCEKFGTVEVSKLKLFDVFAWIGKQDGWKSPSTFATVDRCLKRLFNWSVRFNLIDKNPIAGLPVPREAIRRNWKDREFVRVVRTSTPSFRRFIYFLVWTGCRPGEAREIEWDNIDWGRSCVMLKLHKTATTTARQKPRTIILIPVAVRLLKWIKEHRGFGRHVFLNDHERPWTGANICRRIERARKRLSLPSDVKPYGLRHLFGTSAIRRGLDIKTLSLLMGHESVKHTERYIHLAGDTSHLLDAAKQATGKLR